MWIRLDLVIEDCEPLEIIEEGFLVTGSPRSVQALLCLLPATDKFSHRCPHRFNPAALKT
ncbi:hypothetical protein MES5069_360173 [Mesorhizobium escarrei]|uniref:Uncharacterized protein n=1 Tax=Mesorhizobium escarrei TaxID=666018 RepID=A0ABN8K1L0_9HYPH|nr:hypothetical protein MES5069_360173 [Mesorhizobium escarrei]